jgi:hypothetical protein
VFKDFTYQTLDSWSGARRVIGKAEHLRKGPNPRFVVTSLPPEEADARTLYEDRYCARRDGEPARRGHCSAAKVEQQLPLFADRSSCADLRANQLRLLFSTIADTLLAAVRAFGLPGTEHTRAESATTRQQLLKLGARITVSCRRVVLSLSEAYPYQTLFMAVLTHLQRLTAPATAPALAPALGQLP